MKISRDPEVLTGLILENPFAGFRGITHCNEALCSRSHRLRAHRHVGVELTYLVFGQVTWQVENRMLRQSTGELSLVNSGRSHCTAPKRHVEFKALCVGLDLMRLGRDGIALHRQLIGHDAYNFGLTPEFEGVLRGIMHQALFPLGSDSRIARKYAELLVAMIDARVHALKGEKGKANKPRRIFSLPVQKAMHYLNQNLGRHLSVSELARAANLGESHFSASFRREVGLAPCAYHRSQRLEAARTALRAPENSIAQIAQELGFSSSQHFSTLFRRAFECTPLRWRKNELKPKFSS